VLVAVLSTGNDKRLLMTNKEDAYYDDYDNHKFVEHRVKSTFNEFI